MAETYSGCSQEVPDDWGEVPGFPVPSSTARIISSIHCTCLSNSDLSIRLVRESESKELLEAVPKTALTFEELLKGPLVMNEGDSIFAMANSTERLVLHYSWMDRDQVA